MTWRCSMQHISRCKKKKGLHARVNMLNRAKAVTSWVVNTADQQARSRCHCLTCLYLHSATMYCTAGNQIIGTHSVHPPRKPHTHCCMKGAVRQEPTLPAAATVTAAAAAVAPAGSAWLQSVLLQHVVCTAVAAASSSRPSGSRSSRSSSIETAANVCISDWSGWDRPIIIQVVMLITTATVIISHGIIIISSVIINVVVRIILIVPIISFVLRPHPLDRTRPHPLEAVLPVQQWLLLSAADAAVHPAAASQCAAAPCGAFVQP